MDDIRFTSYLQGFLKSTKQILHPLVIGSHSVIQLYIVVPFIYKLALID
jgi:hypothetical protein